MSAPPKTVLTATPEEEAAIRAAVRKAADHTVAGPEHVDGLLALLSDPRVSDPIYDLPRPFTRESVAKWVADSEALRQEGRCILAVTLDDEGQVAGYSRFSVWPERSSAELAGARRADLQNTGGGRIGVARSIAWMFEDLGVPPLDPAVDRLMLCGGPSVLADIKKLLEARGYVEGSLSAPGDYVLERAFVET